MIAALLTDEALTVSNVPHLQRYHDDDGTHGTDGRESHYR